MPDKTAARNAPGTYLNLRIELEKLLALAARFELIGEKGQPVTEDPDFDGLAVQWRRQMRMVMTLGSVI